jgi:5-methylcytosine-specific restriction endonuclease McrA
MNCVLAKGTGVSGICYWCAGELPKRRRKWCSVRCVKEYVSNHRYSNARRVARRRDKYQCVTCGSKEKLEVNHILNLKDSRKNYGWGCQHHLSGLETLCRKCHVKVTNKQREERKRGKR